jgi:L-2-hydroxyglutarate oxidase LhgO
LNEVDCIVIGAGVIGLAVARALAHAGREVIIIERERHPGLHTSSRNSEVIHAGIHYPPGSLKAQLCRRGKELLYRYGEEHGIGLRRCGKLTVVASAAEEGKLQALDSNARANGVELAWLDAKDAQRLEPELHCAMALLSPSTGVIDSAGLLQCLLGDAERHGATAVFGSAVTALQPVRDGIQVSVDGEPQASVRARWVINCAGLSAARLAASIADFPRAWIPSLHFAKGHYFSLPGRAPFSHLIYPAPGASGHLGVHLTLDLAGSARFGPDLQWLEALDDAHPDYRVDAARAGAFIEAIRQYWPGVPAQRLAPAYAGIRPKLSGPGEPAQDFRILGPDEHGVAGIIHLFGIESPGLTSCLALGEMIAAMLDA